MILDKNGILAQRLTIEKVAVPWLGDDSFVYVRALPAHVLEKSRESKELQDAFIFVNVAVTESGDRLFKDEDARELAEKVSGDLIALVVASAFRLAQVPEDRQSAIKKNWKTPQPDSSGESP